MLHSKLSIITLLTLTPFLFASDVIKLEKIAVTATKTARSLSNLPANVRIITAEEIQSSGATSVDELLKSVAGVDVVHNLGVLSSGSSSKVIMRGVGGTGESRTLLLVDGVPMNSSFSGSVEWNQIPLDSIERIEVVKGASSALYGSNAMGGVIHIITKKPSNNLVKTAVSIGSMNTKIGTFQLNGKKDRFGYSLVGEVTNSDGYIIEREEDREANTIKTSMKRKNALLGLSYDFDESSDISLSHSYYKNSQFGGLEIPSFDYNPGVDVSKMTQLSYRKKFQNGSDTEITLFQKSNESYNDYLKNALTLEYENRSETDEKGMVAKYSYPFENHTVTFGVDAQLADVQSRNDYPAAKVVLSRGEQDYYALFLQEEIFLGENVVMNIGGRFDYYKNHDGAIHDEKTNTYQEYETRTFNALSPKVALLYHLSNATTLRGSYGSAFRAPSVNDLYKNTIKNNKISAGNPNLDPETIRSFDIALDQDITDNAHVSIAMYHSVIKDYIYSLLAPASSPYYKEKINVGEAKIQGIETEVEYKALDKLNLFANYTYTEATIEKFDKDTTLEGKDIIRVPKHKASAGFYYSDPSLFDLKMSTNYVGKRFEDDMNSIEYKSYMTCDVKISKKIDKKFEFSLSATDLFDASYEEKYLSPGRVIFGSMSIFF